MPETRPSAVVFHLSDLHFTGRLINRQASFPQQLNGHSFPLVQQASALIRRLIEEYGGREKATVVVTGDLTATADQPSFEEVHNYLRGSKYVSEKMRVGLELESNVLVVPGNHDRWINGWGSEDSRAVYLKYFSTDFPAVHLKRLGGLDVSFFLLDSNISSFWMNFLNLRNSLGTGYIGGDQIEKVKGLHGDLLAGDFAVAQEKPPAGFSYKDSVKIVLLHHHVDLPSPRPKDATQKMLRLKDAEDVKKLFWQIGVDVVLCGHQHESFQEVVSHNGEGKSFLLSCAPSLSILGERKNGFKIYEFFPDEVRTIEYQIFPKQGDVFRPVRGLSYRFSRAHA